MAPAALPLVSLALIAILASGAVSTLSQFTASIANPDNRARSGSVGLTENGTCATPGDGLWHECATVNKFGGGSLAAGGSRTTTVTLRNTGTSPARLFVLPSQCSDTRTGAHGALCAQVSVELRCAGITVVPSRTLNAFHDGRGFPTGYPAGTLAAGTAVTCDVVLVAGPVAMPGTVSQPISWMLRAGG
jgi:hypothetical protein